MSVDYEFIVLEEDRKPNVYAISSICEDGTHIIIWDFDFDKKPKSLFRLENSLKNIQRNFLLSSIYLFESRCGYNAVCLDKIDKHTVTNIKNLTFGDDRKHLEQGILYNWKLRIGSDKKLIEIIDTEHFTKFTRSNAHRIALNNLFNTEIQHNTFFDDNRNICLYSYWDWKVYSQHKDISVDNKNQTSKDEEFTYTDR
jgi:hypothetical protein